MRFSQDDEKDKTIRDKIIARLGEDGFKQWEEDCLVLFNLEMEKRRAAKKEEMMKSRKPNKPAKNHPWRSGTFLKKVPKYDY